MKVLLAVCLALMPARLRKIREEQWSADLRDAPDMGISPTSLLFGAAYSAVTARFHDTVHRGGMLLSRLTKGMGMKLALGLMGTTAVILGGIALGAQENSVQPLANEAPPVPGVSNGTVPAPDVNLKAVDHPECYDEVKMNDPKDFCYQTMGPWNSTLATAEEVRASVSVESMVTQGLSTQQIRAYYPEYTPKGK